MSEVGDWKSRRRGPLLRYCEPPHECTARVATDELRAVLRSWEEVRCQEQNPQKDVIHNRAAALLADYCALSKTGWFDQDGIRYSPAGGRTFFRLKIGPVRRRR